MDNLVRLNKFIASNGISSRRKVDELITEGRVTVNGNTIVELGFKIDPEKDKIKLDGETIRTSTKKIYLMLNKPKGVITSVSDDKNRATVIDIIKSKEKIFPVGRLDYNTSGLLLLTNDGELSNKLMHPKSEIYKTYFVQLSKPLEERHRLKITGGVELEGKKTAPAKIRYPKKNNNYQDLYISIYEGRNRQVRNMFEHYGYFVRELERTEYAGLKLGELKEGEWRKLTPEELTMLNSIVKETPANFPKLVNTEKKKFKKVFKKYDNNKYDSNKKDFKKDYNKFDKSSDKRNSKWGFKEKQTADRDSKLGFKKIDSRDESNDVKRDFNKSDKRSDKKDFKAGFKKFDKRDDRKDVKRDFKKFDKRDDRKDVKRDFKKFDKRNDKKDFKTGYKKFDKRDDMKDVKRDFKEFDKSSDKKDFKTGRKKFGTSDDKKDVKRDFKKFDRRDDKKDVKGDFKRFDRKDDKKDAKRKFQKVRSKE